MVVQKYNHHDDDQDGCQTKRCKKSSAASTQSFLSDTLRHRSSLSSLSSSRSSIIEVVRAWKDKYINKSALGAVNIVSILTAPRTMVLFSLFSLAERPKICYRRNYNIYFGTEPPPLKEVCQEGGWSESFAKKIDKAYHSLFGPEDGTEHLQILRRWFWYLQKKKL